MFEIIQKHEIQDIYRICNGVLLKVSKFEISDTHWDWVNSKNNKAALSKVECIKNCYKLKQNVIVNKYWNNEGDLVNKDTIIFEDSIITLIDEPSDYYYELKTTGNAFSGDFEGFSELLSMVEQIKNQYIKR